MDTSEFDIEFLSLKLAENPKSPLFARLADLYLQQQQTVEALKLCEEGIMLFPDYYAGHIVLGKIHASLNEFSDARAAFEKAQALSPFNPAIAALIGSIPNQPDASTRTTDENYFAPAETPQAAEPAPAEETPAVQETTAEPPQFEMATAEELGFSHPVEETEASPGEMIGEQNAVAHQPGEPFSSYDDYYARHQARTSEPPAQSLDEYLNSSGTAAPREQSPAPHVPEPGLDIAEPEIQQPSDEPEMIFSSPEQAQLFAEMTGGMPAEEIPEAQHTDIDDLAEKLQNVERIVPQESPPSPESADDGSTSQSFGTEMVTPTLAEIYASQGEYTAAIQAYEILMFSQPGKTAEFQARVRELQRMQMEKDGLV